MPKVSVIIPVYNTENFLRKCLDSVCNQTLQDIEIICINDCSQDNCLEILKAYALSDTRVRIIDFKENRGAGAARNAGIEAAQGEYIGFVDSDDFIDLDFYEKLYNSGTKTKANVVKGAVEHTFLGGQILKCDNREFESNNINFNSIFPSAIYQKNFLRKYNIRFLENCSWGEDRLFPVMAVYYTNSVVYKNDVYYHYKRNAESSTASTYTMAKFVDNLKSVSLIISFLNGSNYKKEEYITLYNTFFMDIHTNIFKNIKNLDIDNVISKLESLVDLLKYKDFVNIDYFTALIELLKRHSSEDIPYAIENLRNDYNRKRIIATLRATSNLKTNQTKIPVFLSADEHYAPFVATTMASICYNTKSFCEFYILDAGISEESKEKICELKKQFNNFSIEFINVDLEKYFRNFQETKDITKAMYSRFLIPILKPELDKVIYSDVDVTFMGDIREMFDEPLNNYPLGAVWEMYAEHTFNIERKHRLHLSDCHRYFSSGNLLIDCKKWRENDITNKLIGLVQSNTFKLNCPDQDIMNIYFDNNYQILPTRYSYINQNFTFFHNHNNILIRHFNGPNKPWFFGFKSNQFEFLNNIEDFWNYARMTVFGDYLLKNIRYKTDKVYKHELKKEISKKQIAKIKLRRKYLAENNIKTIQALKDKFNGERCFIIGGAPSLNQLDLTKLNNEFTFTVNRGYMMREKGLSHSTFHVMSDVNTFDDENVINEIPLDFMDKLFLYTGIDKFNPDGALYFDFYPLGHECKFQTDLTKPLSLFGSVIFFAIQIAYYLGFKQIILIGVDLDYVSNMGHAYKETAGEVSRQYSHSILCCREMMQGLEVAQEFLTKEGVSILNASPAGKVDCMPRVKYEELFDE